MFYIKLIINKVATILIAVICGEQRNTLANLKDIESYRIERSKQKAHGIHSLYIYEGGVKTLINELKYKLNLEAITYCASTLSKYISGIDAKKIGIIPVPSNTRSVASRGYNHMNLVAYEISRTFSNTQIVSVFNLLINTSTLTQKQSRSRQERFANIQNKIKLLKKFEHPTHIDAWVVIDDVTTTGATLQAAHKTLSDFGLKHIYLVAIARKGLTC